jgi:hypothetical protein
MSMHCFTAIVVKNRSTIRIKVIIKETDFLYGTNGQWVKSRNSNCNIYYTSSFVLRMEE